MLEKEDALAGLLVPIIGALGTFMAVSAGLEDHGAGVGHFRQGCWDVAAEWFPEDPQKGWRSGALQFHLALAPDTMSNPDEATAEFTKAAELAPTTVAIGDSPMLKKLLGMSPKRDDRVEKAGPGGGGI